MRTLVVLGWPGMVVIAVTIALLLLELVLRIGFGFGNPPLYIGDERIGYLLAPGQQVRRFGNRIRINEYSMRAESISPRPAKDTFRLLLLGDSLANGNWWTDQANILSEQIARDLRPDLPAKYLTIEALNASANSWGPRNQLAYLDRYGTFGSTVLVLLMNTDDLFATRPTPLQVGRDRSYPNRKPPFALAEAFGYVAKRQPAIPGLQEIRNEGGDRVGQNLNAVKDIHQTITADGGQFILVLSPLKRELPGSKDYEQVARKRLQTWATEANVPYLDLLETYQRHPHSERLYRDHIHLSPQGTELVAGAIAQLIKQASF